MPPWASSRARHLNDAPAGPGRYVLYWMQASQRTRFNHALEYAVLRANELGLPLLVCFGLTDSYPEANLRHYAFMLQGLRDVDAALRRRGIRFVIRHGEPAHVAASLSREAAWLVCDRGYTRHQKAWRDYAADHAPCRVTEVESDVVVPVEAASDKQEYAARTIRPKLLRLICDYLRDLPENPVMRPSLRLRVAGDFDPATPDATLALLRVDRSVLISPCFVGGQETAGDRLDSFVRDKLAGYAHQRSEPAAAHTSTLGAYLHFGQISPVEVARRVRGAAPDASAFLEELIVRRELSVNFTHYCARYDSYECVPEWAKRTLGAHRQDKRPRLYSRERLDSAATDDAWWNAAQTEMLKTGFMHNYMRMYWGKKIIEWSRTPEEAYATALALNNKYFLCGRGPNAFANVAWLFGLHDRPWGPGRPVFGAVRYMNAAGLERKFDMPAYARRVAAL